MSTRLSPITINHISWDHPDSVRLRAAQQQEIADTKPAAPANPSTAANVPVFIVAYDGDLAVGCAGLRVLESGHEVEIKRMYVSPSHRGRRPDGSAGVAVLILQVLERTARSRGWTTIVAKTSPAMAKARGFYEAHEYLRGKDDEHGEVCSVKVLWGH